MSQCAYKKRDGSPCKGVSVGSHGGCFAHDGDFELQRKRDARRNGKRGGRGRPNPGSADLLKLQSRFEDLADKVLAGEVGVREGAIAIQAWNGARSAILGVASIRESEEFEMRLAELERQRGLS